MTNPKTCHCPEINDRDWRLQDLDWSGKIFYFDYLPHILNAPLGFDKRLQDMKSQIGRKGYKCVNPQMVLYLPGMFQGRLLMEIEDPEQYDANVEIFENARILTRVHKGPSSRIGNTVEELKAFVQDRTHILPTIIYRWPVTCPICANQKGGDKTILLARV